MQSVIVGKVYVLGDNVDTDQIIPAQYLSFNPADPAERRYFGRYANSGVPEQQAGLPGGHIRFVPEGQFRSEFSIIVAGRNFGCGSSREHAPLALAEAGVRCVIAESYARIFFRNAVNGGYLIPFESSARLIDRVCTGDELEVHVDSRQAINRTRNQSEAGGIFQYARQAGMLNAAAGAGA
jgi:3-isopropylmalate/(R)-2-methylmalate dehydratase small subunit